MSIFSLFKKVLASLAVGSAALAQAAPGDLDPTFGTGGKVTARVWGGSSGEALAIQADGKLVVGGSTYYGAGIRPALVRFFSDGSIDTSFGDNGIVTTSAEAGGVLKIVQQADGKLVAVGNRVCGIRNCFVVSRYNLNGSLDGSFGVGGEIIRNYSITLGNSMARAVLVQPDGKIVAAGYADVGISGSEFVIARFFSDGNIDSSFGLIGVSRITFPGAGVANAIVLQPDGKLVVGGYARSDNGFGLARLGSSGNLDVSFGFFGKTTISFSGISAEVKDLVLQPDGKIIAAGGGISSSSGFALARYNPNGTLDTGFGSAGQVLTTTFGPASAYSVILQSDGKLVAAGDINDQFGLVRYLSNGTPDTTFGTNGGVQTDFGSSHSSVNALAQQFDGKLVAAGENEAGLDFALARYANQVAASATALASSPNPAPVGQTITFTATVDGANPTGAVTFSEGATSLCNSVTLVGTGNIKTASCIVSFSTAGVHTVSASYGGDANNNPSSANLVQQIEQATTTTILMSSLNPSVVGQSVTFTATVSGVDPTGTVRFQDGTTAIPGCSAIVLTGVGDGKTASCTTASLLVGSHTLSSVYSGDTNNVSSSAPLAQLVNVPTPAATTTTLSSSLNPSLSGQSVTFTAAVNGTNVTGTVDFSEGAAVLCNGVLLAGTGSARLASCTTSSLTVGSHTISATYRGDANNDPSTATLVQQVNGSTRTVTTATLSSSLNPSVFGQSVTLTAEVNGNNPGGTVSFQDGATFIVGCNAVPLTGTGSSKTAVCIATVLTAGAHTIGATYSGDSINLQSSASLVQTVTSASTGVSAAPALSGTALLFMAALLGGLGFIASRSGRQ